MLINGAFVAQPRQIVRGLLSLFCMHLLCAAPAQAQTAESTTIVSYNIHHGAGTDGRLDLERIARVLEKSQADIVALQEVDRNVSRSGNVDQAKWLAERLGMHYAFGKNIPLSGGAYGNAILSKWPIEAENHLLPNDDGEQRGFLHARIKVTDVLMLNLLATHFDHRRPNAQRIASVESIQEFVAGLPHDEPLILAGDLNATPDAPSQEMLAANWIGSPEPVFSIPSADPRRQIDYILLRQNPFAETRHFRLTNFRGIQAPVESDHSPVAADLQWSEEGFELRKILFGSCIQQDQPMPILGVMASQRPDLTLFLGDNIYADTNDIEVMRTKYQSLGANVDFRSLVVASPVLATWDDHDFGINDGGADFPIRSEAQAAFLDFWQVPNSDPRRGRDGIYMARSYGPTERRVQVIMLDTRFFRSPLRKGQRRVGGPYLPDDAPEKTILGTAQWNWLEDQLRQPAKLRLLVSSIQCLPSDAGQETWSNLPRQRQRLLELIENTRAGGVILLSGDRHWSELSVEREAAGYPLYELTSSSFNQIHPRGTPTENAARDASVGTYHRPNFGRVSIDWQSKETKVTLGIHDVQGNPVFEKSLSLDDLHPKNSD